MNANVRFTPAEQQQFLEAELAGRFPDARGRFGPYGGRYVPETLIPALERLEAGMREHLPREDFQRELAGQLDSWVGRPTALSHAPRLSAAWGAEVWFKREDLAHTGAHKINNALGQALLARPRGGGGEKGREEGWREREPERASGRAGERGGRARACGRAGQAARACAASECNIIIVILLPMKLLG